MKAATDLLRADWEALWQAVGAAPSPALFDRLTAAWSEPQRHYHTLQHLAECLALFPRLSGLTAHPVEVELALWFDDAVYATGRHDNEARSAEWARQEMLAARLPAAKAERVVALVMATCHDATPATADARVVVDIDLAILGAAPARFDDYERQVRQEYGHLPATTFCRGRAAILQHFLDRAWIYHTPPGREHFEAQARDNLERSLRALRMPG